MFSTINFATTFDCQYKMKTCCWLSILIFLNCSLALQKPFSPRYKSLRKFNLELDTVTVSGFSNGGAFSVYLSFIYSSIIRGVGSFAGGPFGTLHIVHHKVTSLLKLQDYYKFIDKWSAEGAIDPVRNLRRTKAFVFHGLLDVSIPKILSVFLAKEFRHYGANTRSNVGKVACGHCLPTNNYPPNGDYIPLFGTPQCVCNPGYQGLNDMFQHFYGPRFIQPPSNNATPSGYLYKFDQNEFTKCDHAEGYGLANYGYIYIPKLCMNGQFRCKLHLAFQGLIIQLLARVFSDGYYEFVHHAGYLQIADSNNVIILFPDVAPLNVLGMDIWGIMTGDDYQFKNGTHPSVVYRMMKRVLYGI